MIFFPPKITHYYLLMMAGGDESNFSQYVNEGEFVVSYLHGSVLQRNKHFYGVKLAIKVPFLFKM